MAATTNLRTVWLTLRATNYTTAILMSAMKQLDGMITQQKNMALAQIEMGKSALMAGTMFTVLGQQIGGTGGKMLSLTGNFMQIMGIMSMVAGITKALSMAQMQNTVTVFGMDLSYQSLAISIGAAFAVFMIMSYALQSFPKWADAVIAAIMGIVAALILLFTWENITTMGLAMVGGLAGGAAAAGLAASGVLGGGAPSYQMGTMSVPHTGLAMLHEGEVVYNPHTGTPAAAGGMGGTTVIDASMNVETMNTKMDKDDMNDIMKKQSRTIAMNNR
jgi:hypothetical protein